MSRRAWLLGATTGLVGCATLRPRGEAFDLAHPTMRVRETAARITVGATTPRERAQRIFAFVRDEIAFGFTKRFDRATPSETLDAGRGHCNPQGTLFVALARAAGLDARQHFVSIDNEVLHGLFPQGLPAQLDHSYAELRLAERWIRLDGYIIDPPLYRAGLVMLRQSERELGWGLHRNGINAWDGSNDCMVQYVSDTMALPDGDHGSFIDPRVFYASDRYSQGMGPIANFFYSTFAVPEANRRLDALRTT